jgi:hypothetical protein
MEQFFQKNKKMKNEPSYFLDIYITKWHPSIKEMQDCFSLHTIKKGMEKLKIHPAHPTFSDIIKLNSFCVEETH